MAKRVLAILLFISCLLCAEAGAVSLEQVQPVMPDISVFVHSDGQNLAALDTSAIQATMDGKPLTTGKFTESEEGIFYVFMLDISRSISQNYLDAAKQAVLNTYRQMRQQDRLAVITFGDKVSVLLDGSESAQDVSAKLDSVKSADDNTCFYEAMDTLIKTASAKTDMRHVAIVVSDGVEDADSNMTQEKLEQTLQQGGVAVYALAVDSTSAESLRTFQSFVDVSGGKLFTFSPANAQDKLNDLLKQIDEIWCLTLKADSNIADGATHTLCIRFGELGEVSTTIKPDKWTPDDTIPYILSLTPDEAAGTITVAFSEAMDKVDNLSCYQLLSPEGRAAPLTLISSDADTVTFSAAGFSRDGWTMSFTGLTDASMEKNAMPDCVMPLSGETEAASMQTAVGKAQPAANDRLSPVIMIVIAIAAIAVLVAALILLRKRRGGGGEAAPDIGTKHVFKVKKEPGSSNEDRTKIMDKKSKGAKAPKAMARHVFTAGKNSEGDTPKFFFNEPQMTEKTAGGDKKL